MSLLIMILIWLVIAAVVLYFVQYILAQLPIDAGLRGVILAVIALLILLVFLQRVGVF